jgi:hypothetical protein
MIVYSVPTSSGYNVLFMKHTDPKMPSNIRFTSVRKARRPTTSRVSTIKLSQYVLDVVARNSCLTLPNIHVQGYHHHQTKKASIVPHVLKPACSDWEMLLSLNIIELKKMSKHGLEANLGILNGNIITENDLGLFDV